MNTLQELVSLETCQYWMTKDKLLSRPHHWIWVSPKSHWSIRFKCSMVSPIKGANEFWNMHGMITWMGNRLIRLQSYLQTLIALKLHTLFIVMSKKWGNTSEYYLLLQQFTLIINDVPKNLPLCEWA